MQLNVPVPQLLSLAICAQMGFSVVAVAEPSTKGSATNKKNSTGQKKPRGRISEAQALNIIAARPDIRKWQHEVQAASKMQKTSAHIEFDHKEGHDLVVHVYEEVSDGGEEPHTATMNWYHVNDLTGKVKVEL